jgi:hypothetical protein
MLTLAKHGIALLNTSSVQILIAATPISGDTKM